jgi:hypothetical protein
LLDNKDLILGFTNPYDISTLTTTGSNPTLTLSEHVTTGTGTPIPMTLTAASATGLTVNIDRSAASTYAIKCNQQYDFTLTTGAKDTFGNTASAEGGGKDVHFFRTAPFAPQPFSSSASRVINRKTSGSAPGLTTCSSLSPCFVVTFNAPLDVASTNALLARCGGTDPKKCPMQVFTTPSGGQPTFAAMSCPAISTGAKEIACQPSAPLTSATRYTASFVILSTPTTEKLQAASPAPVLGPPDYATQVGSQTMPLDAGPTGTCTFSGNSSVTFTTSGTTC